MNKQTNPPRRIIRWVSLAGAGEVVKANQGVWLLTRLVELARFFCPVFRVPDGDFLCGRGAVGPIYAQARGISLGAHESVSVAIIRFNHIIGFEDL